MLRKVSYDKTQWTLPRGDRQTNLGMVFTDEKTSTLTLLATKACCFDCAGFPCGLKKPSWASMLPIHLGQGMETEGQLSWKSTTYQEWLSRCLEWASVLQATSRPQRIENPNMVVGGDFPYNALSRHLFADQNTCTSDNVSAAVAAFGVMFSHAALPREQTVAKTSFLADWHLFVTQPRWKQTVHVESLVSLHAYRDVTDGFRRCKCHASSSGKSREYDQSR